MPGSLTTCLPTHHRPVPILRLMLTLPQIDGRYDLLSTWQCVRCGHQATALSWSRNTGRHLTYQEMTTKWHEEQVQPYDAVLQKARQNSATDHLGRLRPQPDTRPQGARALASYPPRTITVGSDLGTGL